MEKFSSAIGSPVSLPPREEGMNAPGEEVGDIEL